MSYSIGTQHLELHQQHRLLLTKTDVIKLTPTEYRLVVCLLDERIAYDEVLASRALSNRAELSKATRETLEKHINNLRSKLRSHHLNIYRVHNLGYILADEQSQQHHQTRPQLRVVKQQNRILAS
jgi:DNA-binding response OmpR family regulator